MRPHLSLDMRNVSASVQFYQKVFGVAPQKQTETSTKGRKGGKVTFFVRSRRA